MSAPTLMKQTRIAVADVVVRDRLRPVSEAGVEALIASINEIGVMKDAIHVRKHYTGEFRLLAGAHRLAAAERLGWDEIEAKVWTDVTDDWARLIEIDDNLAGAEMNALDTAVFLATRKVVYERLHPETRADAFKGNRHTGSLAAELSSFASTISEKMGITDRQVRKIIAAGSRLGPDEIRQLRLAPRPVTLADLQAISGIGEAPERYDVVRQLATGEAKSAAAARKAYFHRENPLPPVDPTSAELTALMEKWRRARKEARRRFVAEHFDELAVLVTEESARHGDKAVYYNRALPLDGGDGA